VSITFSQPHPFFPHLSSPPFFSSQDNCLALTSRSPDGASINHVLLKRLGISTWIPDGENSSAHKPKSIEEHMAYILKRTVNTTPPATKLIDEMGFPYYLNQPWLWPSISVEEATKHLSIASPTAVLLSYEFNTGANGEPINGIQVHSLKGSNAISMFLQPKFDNTASVTAHEWTSQFQPLPTEVAKLVRSLCPSATSVLLAPEVQACTLPLSLV